MSVAATPFDLDAPRPGRTASSGGSLTWLAAALVAAVSLSAAALTGNGALFWASAAATLVATIFALRPDVGLMLVIISRPSLDLWAETPVAEAVGLRLNVAALGALTLIVVGGAYVAEQWSLVRRSPAIVPFLAFTAIAALGVSLSPGGTGVYEWLRLVSLLVLYSACYAVVRSSENPRRLAATLLLSAALPVAVALYQMTGGGTRVIADFGRATGTFLHPVPFGIFLGLVIAFATPLVLSRALPWGFRVAAPLALVALVGTYTRTAWLGALFGLLLVAVKRHRSLLVLAPLLVAVIAVAAPSTVARSTALDERATTAADPGSSIHARFTQWETNFPKIRRNPVTGLGLGSIVAENRSLVHSDYLRAAVETGVFGLAAYVWLLCATVGGCYRSVQTASRAGDRIGASVALGALAAAAAFVAVSAASNLMTQVVVAGTFWCMVAVGHAAARPGARPSP